MCRSPHFSAMVQLISLPLYLLSLSYPQSTQGRQLPEAFKDLSFPRVEALSSAPGVGVGVGGCFFHAVSLPRLFPRNLCGLTSCWVWGAGLGSLLLSECHQKGTVRGRSPRAELVGKPSLRDTSFRLERDSGGIWENHHREMLF